MIQVKIFYQVNNRIMTVEKEINITLCRHIAFHLFKTIVMLNQLHDEIILNSVNSFDQKQQFFKIPTKRYLLLSLFCLLFDLYVGSALRHSFFPRRLNSRLTM